MVIRGIICWKLFTRVNKMLRHETLMRIVSYTSLQATIVANHFISDHHQVLGIYTHIYTHIIHICVRVCNAQCDTLIIYVYFVHSVYIH